MCIFHISICRTCESALSMEEFFEQCPLYNDYREEPCEAIAYCYMTYLCSLCLILPSPPPPPPSSPNVSD